MLQQLVAKEDSAEMQSIIPYLPYAFYVCFSTSPINDILEWKSWIGENKLKHIIKFEERSNLSFIINCSIWKCFITKNEKRRNVNAQNFTNYIIQESYQSVHEF